MEVVCAQEHARQPGSEANGINFLDADTFSQPCVAPGGFWVTGIFALAAATSPAREVTGL